MTVMPDLDPDSVAFVAFFNVIEQGGLPESEVTWSDVTDNSSVQWVDQYDNGLILGYSNGPWDNTRVRCKTDGWVVAYNHWDGTITEGVSLNRRKGVHELTPTGISGWGESGYIDGPPEQNRFAKAVSDIAHSLSGSGAMSFSYSDVGFYDFLYGADSLSTFFHTIGSEDSDTNASRDVNLLSGTTVDRCDIGASVYYYGGATATVSADGITVADSDNLGLGSTDSETGHGVYNSTALLADDGQLTAVLDAMKNTGATATVATLWSEDN